MLVLIGDQEDKRTPVGDEAIRARLIQDGSIRTASTCRNWADGSAFEALVKAYEAVARGRGKTSDFANGLRSALARMVCSLEPEDVARSEAPGTAIARALGIKTLVNKLSASVVSRLRNALSTPTVKSIGFYSSLKLAGHNAP